MNARHIHMYVRIYVCMYISKWQEKTHYEGAENESEADSDMTHR